MSTEETKPTRVIFLDIDGPVIPFGQYIINRNASWTRDLADIPFAIIKELQKKTAAVIVFNTTHNIPIEGIDDIKDIFIKNGMPKEAFHEDDRTQFPHFTTRLKAILDWLENHPEVTDWVALDDELFTNRDWLIHVDFNTGITPIHMNAVYKAFGMKEGFFL